MQMQSWLEWLRFLCGTWTVVQPSQSDESEPMRNCNSASSGCVNLSPLTLQACLSLCALQLEYDIEDVSKEGGGVGKC